MVIVSKSPRKRQETYLEQSEKLEKVREAVVVIGVLVVGRRSRADKLLRSFQYKVYAFSKW